MTHDRPPGDRPAVDRRPVRHLLAWADGTGLTVRELRILLALADSPPLGGGAAAAAAGLLPTVAYQAVEGLRRRDLIVEDRRRYRLTADGAALAAGLQTLPDGPRSADRTADGGSSVTGADPPPPTRPPGARIVVGVDGSAAARAALRWAAAEAGLRHAVLHVVHAWPHPTIGVGIGLPAGGVMVEDPGQGQAAATRLLTDIVDRELGGVELATRRSVGRGEPVEVLLEAATGAGLLVLGSRSGALTGSVTRRLTRRAGCPVVIVGPAAA